MALEWDLRECDPAERAKHEDATEALIWYVMFTGLGWQVTEENVEEFVARIRTLEAWGSGITDDPLPEEAIRAHIGLRCNVAPEPRAKWLLRQFAATYPKASPGCPECGSTLTPTAEVTWTDDSSSHARLDSMRLETRCPDCSHLVRSDLAYTTKVLVLA